MAGLQNKNKLIFSLIFLSLLIFVSACTRPIDQNADKTVCKEEDRTADVCIQLAKPVCGYNKENQIGTYSNSCYACKDQKVEYWIDSQCSSSSACDYNDPNKKYIETSKERCELIRFMCEPGSEPFSNECGCGCVSILDDEEELDKSLEELDSISDI